jgi:putative membrane protein
MIEYYNYIKALHLIFVTTWFAGLFYVPRLFIYHIEAQDKSDTEREILSKQLKLMTRRLWYIITWPSAILATFFALLLLYHAPYWLDQPWMHTKLFFVIILILYHLKTHFIFKSLQNNIFKYSSNFMRFWNEGATLLLFAIIFLVILKNTINMIYGLFSLIALSAILFFAIRLYKNQRES